ncbi:helix-hairpin-helix domain-containing protein [Marinilactibacillus kalidii]|uniref:helix-hairpin-helix domain-containing protein n=1 Tax=Marinilactibacillus kalidii TaxID=2820274 RepID=UPI001ABDD529|nr:helix-hairpin-helix domain-containing protein [Marinilactibacillus kalidii]
MQELIDWIRQLKVKKIYIIGMLIIMVIVYFSLLINLKRPEESEIPEEDIFRSSNDTIEEADEAGAISSIETENKDVMIELKGQVEQPGVYKVEENDRLIDAVKLAGGLTDNADDRSINMALKISDQMMIYIPFVGEEGVEETEDESVENQANHKININSAELQLLTELNGIGNARAQSIIEYREEKGRFKEIEEIKNISGIGEKIFESIKDEIMVD